MPCPASITYCLFHVVVTISVISQGIPRMYSARTVVEDDQTTDDSRVNATSLADGLTIAAPISWRNAQVRQDNNRWKEISQPNRIRVFSFRQLKRGIEFASYVLRHPLFITRLTIFIEEIQWSRYTAGSDIDPINVLLSFIMI